MNNKLNRFSENITSQHGEDGILQYIIESLGDKIIKRCCEFGAWDGVFASNTYNLWFNQDWEAVLIEGAGSQFAELKDNIKGKNAKAFNTYLTVRGKDSLDSIFKANNLDPGLGVLSIDIDSFDYHLWKNLEYVDSQIVVIEFNQHIPAYMEYHDLEGEVYLRCSAKSLSLLGAEKGYKIICCTKTNAIFIKNELFDPVYFPDSPVEYLFDWSEIAPTLIKIGDAGNKYPVWSKKNRTALKLLIRTYYRLSSLFKREQAWKKPTAKAIEQLKKFGMDI